MYLFVTLCGYYDDNIAFVVDGVRQLLHIAGALRSIIFA